VYFFLLRQAVFNKTSNSFMDGKKYSFLKASALSDLFA